MEALIKHWHNHGLSVAASYDRLLANPSITNNADVERFIQGYTHLPGIEQYHIHHDISKPFIRVVDAEGKAHYPNHWVSSSKLYSEKFGYSIISDLILHDMDFHTKKGDELIETWELPYATHLYVTAWAEIFANAELFGGIESDSFKIKRKKLIKALKFNPISVL